MTSDMEKIHQRGQEREKYCRESRDQGTRKRETGKFK